MSHFRYTEEEIDELCRIPPWTDSSLDKQTKRIHDQVPLTRKCIVNQCLFWCDVAQRFKRSLHSKRVAVAPQDSDGNNNQNAQSSSESNFIVGVIGCGSVGSKFVRELVKRDIVKPNQIKISSRTPSRAKQRCGLEVIQSNVEIASHCTILFIFVLPFHFRNFSREIRDAIQGSRPLVVSSLAGFTQMYLQRALNTPFLITTGVDMPTIQTAAEHLNEEFPLASFSTGDELVHFQDYFMGVFEPGGEMNPTNPTEGDPKPKETNDDQKEQTNNNENQDQNQNQENANDIHKLTLQNGTDNEYKNNQDPQNKPESSQLQEASVSKDQNLSNSQNQEGEQEKPKDDNDNIVNPFTQGFSQPKLLRKVHEASFAAENLSNCGFDFLTNTINALKDWVALDSNYAKIQAKPETYNKLWARSFIPLSSLNRVESIQTSGSVEQQMPVRFMLKRAFIRSLIGIKFVNMDISEQQKMAPLSAT